MTHDLIVTLGDVVERERVQSCALNAEDHDRSAVTGAGDMPPDELAHELAGAGVRAVLRNPQSRSRCCGQSFVSGPAALAAEARAWRPSRIDIVATEYVRRD